MKKIYSIGAIILVIVVIMGFAIMKMNRSNIPTQTGVTLQNQVKNIPVLVPTRGYFKLQTPTNPIKGNPLTIQVLADSDKEDISGFDLLVSYDQTAFNYVSAVSVDSDFKAYAVKRDTHISITSVKSLQSKNPTIFQATPALSITFIPLKSGTFTFTLAPQIDKETSGMVNTQTKKIIPSLNTVIVTVP